MKWILFVLLSTAMGCFAQAEPQAATLEAEPQAATLEAELAKCKTESADYMDRINKLVVQLKRMDANIERDIARTLEFTERYSDSADTGGRIMKSKEDILRDLMTSIKRYSRMRKDIMREISRDQRYVKEDMIKIRDWIDGKVTLRVKQITQVITSLGGYNYYGGGYGDDDDHDAEREKDLAEDAADEKKDMVRKMRKGIDVLSERSEDLEKELANLKAKRPLEDINNELVDVNDKIRLLENSIDDIYSKESHASRVGESASREVRKEMRTRVKKLKSSSTSFFRSFDAMMRMLRKQTALNISIEKYEFAIEQLNAGS